MNKETKLSYYKVAVKYHQNAIIELKEMIEVLENE